MSFRGDVPLVERVLAVDNVGQIKRVKKGRKESPTMGENLTVTSEGGVPDRWKECSKIWSNMIFLGPRGGQSVLLGKAECGQKRRNVEVTKQGLFRALAEKTQWVLQQERAYGINGGPTSKGGLLERRNSKPRENAFFGLP